MKVFCSLVSIYFDNPQPGIHCKQTVLNFGLLVQRYALRKGLGLVSPPHFVYDFSTKMFLMLYFSN